MASTARASALCNTLCKLISDPNIRKKLNQKEKKSGKKHNKSASKKKITVRKSKRRNNKSTKK
jgi:hypothetical protein